MPQVTPMQVADAVADPARIAALREADLLDTPPEEGFDQLARIAARLLNAPIALVSLVDEDRQFFKSCIGSIPEPFNSKRETPLSHSFCQYVVASKEPLLVEDARVHPLLKDNLAVAELGVVAYLGIPITTPEGLVLGTLCVIDSKPRRWSADQVETMRSLTAAVMSTIEYRSAARTSDRGGTQVQAPGGAGAAPLSVAAEALATAASTWLNRADQYDRSIQFPKPTPENLKQEAECRNALVEAEKLLGHATQEFGQRLEAAGGASRNPEMQAAVELWQACVSHLDAHRRRQEVSARFRDMQATLSEMEREIGSLTSTEQGVRLAMVVYNTMPQ